MDLAASIALIQQTAQEAAAPKRPPEIATGDTRTITYYDPKAPDGPIVTFNVPPEPRTHAVDDLETLAALATAADIDAVIDGHGPALWFSPAGIILVFDREDRRETASMSLHFTEPFHTLQVLDAEGDPLTQKGLIRLLRLRLGVADPATLDRFRRLDWTATATTKAETRHQRESLGKEITAAVQGVEEIPDTLTVTVPVYDLPGLPCPHDVRLGLEVDANEQRFTLVPMPGQLSAAIADAAAAVRLTLARLAPDVPLYCGRP